MRLLTTAEAAAYCGYRATSSLRKAALMKRVRPVGRRSTNGPNIWAEDDLIAFMRGAPLDQRPATPVFSSRAEVGSIDAVAAADEVANTAAVAATAATESGVGSRDGETGGRQPSSPQPGKAKPKDRSVARGPENTRVTARPFNTRQVAAWFRVSVEQVRDWVRRAARAERGRWIARFRQMIAVRKPHGPWCFFMFSSRAGTSRPPAAEARRRRQRPGVPLRERGP
jgi:hypothetical protein